jgi:hypothetical protein
MILVVLLAESCKSEVPETASAADAVASQPVGPSPTSAPVTVPVAEAAAPDSEPRLEPTTDPRGGTIVEGASTTSLAGGEWKTVVRVDTTFEQTGPEPGALVGNATWVDTTPVCGGLDSVAAAIGPYAGLQEKVVADELDRPWSGTYWVDLTKSGRAQRVERWAYWFGFDRVGDVESRLRGIECSPARRGGQDVPFTIFVEVELYWTPDVGG